MRARMVRGRLDRLLHAEVAAVAAGFLAAALASAGAALPFFLPFVGTTDARTLKSTMVSADGSLGLAIERSMISLVHVDW
ncbi:MAG: hypothetical protein J3K34DRAFT_413136 [Monoraphidium minutum]|nr:MAG: hypothetical protein J3K34DRAFT_413136 [Monoraphidium minutum]